MTKIYPNRVLEEGLRAKGANVACMWEMKGPANTAIHWIVCYACEGQTFLVQTYGANAGWDVYMLVPEVRIDGTIDSVLQHLKRR